MNNQTGHSHPVLDSHPAQPDLAWNERIAQFQGRNGNAVRSLIRFVGTVVFLTAVIAVLALFA
jgi:hypothetical protein